MNWRVFIAVLSGTAGFCPLQLRAQRPEKVPTIGFLGTNTPSVQERWTAAFIKRLSELGWAEGRNVEIEYRWAEGRTEQFTKFAAEFARRRVDVIVTSGTPSSLAAKRATTSIPIVFALSADPVGGGLVANLARPGGNVTGLSNQSDDLVAKRLELLQEVLPGFRRLAIMANAANPATLMEMEKVRSTARALGLEVDTVEVRQSEDIAPAFETLKGRDGALYVCTDPLVFLNRIRVNTLALGVRLPTMYGFQTYVEGGGLMSYGANLAELFRRTAEYVDRILRGTKPAGMAIEPPTKFDLVINLRTAKALGLDVPPTLLARADEVIE